MKTHISPRDWEALSAYLDGQLSPNERSRLEKNLRSSTDLRAALEELRSTRALLRSQPRLKSPRNFILTPEMVGKSATQRGLRRGPSSLFPAFSMASVLAGLLFVVILLTDLLNLGPASQPMVAAPAANEPAVTQQVSLFAERQAAPETTVVQATEALPQAPAAAPETAMGQSTEAPAAAPAAQSQVFLATGTPLSQDSQPSSTAGSAAPKLAAETPSGLPTNAPAEEIPIPSGTEPEVQKAVAPTINPPASIEEAGQSQAADMATATETPVEGSPLGFWTEWRVLEAALAGIAIACGLAAFLLHRTGPY